MSTQDQKMEELLRKSIRDALKDSGGDIQEAVNELIVAARKRRQLYDAFVGDPLPLAVDEAVRAHLRRERSNFRSDAPANEYSREKATAIAERLAEGRKASLMYYPVPFLGIFLGEATEQDLSTSISKLEMQADTMLRDSSWFRLIRPKLKGRKVKQALDDDGLERLQQQATKKLELQAA